MPTASYAIAIGSNRRHHRHGGPELVVRAAIVALRAAGIEVLAVGPIVRTAAAGFRGRGFANTAAVVRTPLAPPALLALLKSIERDFGRRPGRRWSSRVLDLDVLLWSGGVCHDVAGRLVVPHPRMAQRRFVLAPLLPIAACWRIGPGGPTVRQARTRLQRGRPVDPAAPRSY